MNRKQKKMLTRIIIASVLMIVLAIITETFSAFFAQYNILLFVLYLIPYLIIGYDILIKAAKGIINGQILDENFLMAIATVGAIIIGLTRSGDYVEAVAVMLFYQIGELFQSYAVGKSRRNISALMDIRPDYANVERKAEGNGEQTYSTDSTQAGTDNSEQAHKSTLILEQVDPDEVEVGSIIVVQPGEKVPIDGVIVEGESTLNTVALTGESLPRDVQAGDEIVSGCINMTGVLKIRTTKEFGESTVSKILDLVENASSRKSRSEAFISKFAKIYTPAVCYGALALAIVPPLVRMLAMGVAPEFGEWIYRALTFLVISCPCALVISIPLSFFAGLGGAGKEGVLVKGSNYLEVLAQTKCVVFDKTGTLTQGVFEVSSVHKKGDSEFSEEQLLEMAAFAESASSHPIGKSIQRAYGGQIDRNRINDIKEIAGHGVIADVDGKKIAAGNDKLMKYLGIDYVNCGNDCGNGKSLIGTIVHIAVDNQYAGHIVISDILKPNAKTALDALKSAGVKKTVMLTGDSAAVANQVAGELGINNVFSELLPDEKVSKVEELLVGQPSNDKLAFVGDGINDAPVLSRADIGIAMGAMGADAAIEAADVVLMDDDPLKISKAIKISRKCMSIVYQNIVFAIGVKVLCLLLGALGIANMWLAIFADVGVMVLAVLNAIRALFVRSL